MESARTGCAKFKRIFALRDEMREYTLPWHLYRGQRVTIQQARRLVRRFVAGGVLVEADGLRRNVIYDFRRYLDLFKDE